MTQNTLSRSEVYDVIDEERNHQAIKWTQDPPLSPSDEIRLIRRLIVVADAEWYCTKDNVVNGTKVNPADLEALRKIAAIAVRAMETWGAVRRE